MFPLVTIAIPTYNRAESYFPQALGSALRQTYSNLEIIVSDNGSTDRTQDIVKGIAEPRLRYFRHEPGIGQRNNYNFCFQQARGSYVLLLHDDDIIDDDFVSACLTAAGGMSEIGMIRTGIRVIDAHGHITYQRLNEVAGQPVDGLFRSWFSGKAPIYCCNTLFSTRRLMEIGYFNSRHFCYADTMAIFRLAAQYPRIDIREVKASFRIHGNEFGFSRRIADWCEDSLDLLRLMGDLAPSSRKEILKSGARFLTRANYNRASNAPSPWERLIGTLKVMRYFGYRRLPSLNVIVHIFYGTGLYNTLRRIKRYAINPLRATSGTLCA